MLSFITRAENDAYSTINKKPTTTTDGHFIVGLFHYCTLTMFDLCSHTTALRKLAAEHKGEYNYWDSTVVKSDE